LYRGRQVFLSGLQKWLTSFADEKAFVLQPDFDPAPTAVRIHRCKYVSQCKPRSCLKRATLIAEKVDAAGRHVRQIELCAQHCEIVIERERARGLEISDRRDECVLADQLERKSARKSLTPAIMF
jgi:hypothetical protein